MLSPKRIACLVGAWVAVGAAPANGYDTLVVLNKVGGTAWLLDPATGDARAKIEVGEGPHEAATSPDGRTAVVCNYGAGTPGHTLSVLGVERGVVVRTIDLSPHARPHGIRYLDDRHVLVTTETSGQLLKVDVEAGAVVAGYEAGGDIHMVDLAPDGTRAYATAIQAGRLGRVDLLNAEGGEAATVATGAGTEALAVRPDGSEIWVGSNREHVLRVVDAGSFEVVAQIDCGVQPIRLAFTRDGRMAMATCILSGDLAVVDADAREIERRVELGGFVAPSEMWAEKSEDEQQELLQRVVREGARPIGVLAGPDGRFVYVANRGLDHIAVVDVESWSVVRRLPTGAGPDGMAWSRIPPGSFE